jgi:hypothetical protein
MQFIIAHTHIRKPSIFAHIQSGINFVDTINYLNFIKFFWIIYC